MGSIPVRVTTFWLTRREKFDKLLLQQRVGVDCSEGPPVPIPNTEVKLTCAEDTVWRRTGKIGNANTLEEELSSDLPP